MEDGGWPSLVGWRRRRGGKARRRSGLDRATARAQRKEEGESSIEVDEFRVCWSGVSEGEEWLGWKSMMEVVVVVVLVVVKKVEKMVVLWVFLVKRSSSRWW